MKNLSMLFGLLLFLSGCFSMRDYMVETDYSYHGNFKKYKSFAFLTEKSPSATRVPHYYYIENVIKKRLETQGYVFDCEKPDFLVAYRVFLKDVEVFSYFQPDMDRWLRNKNNIQEEKYNPTKFKFKEGTLFISFKDFNNHQVVWQGYASSKLGFNDFENERYLQFAVRSILDKYRVLATNNTPRLVQ